jgi:predicted phosphodiesterase
MRDPRISLRVAALYDIHGHLPALEAVLDEVAEERVDAVVLGGDMIAGPMPRETLAVLEGLGDRAVWIRGNAEREARGWVAEQLEPSTRDRLAALPVTATLDVDGLGPTLFCHGSPRSDDEIITTLTPDARLAPMLADVEEPTVVCGHTHVQFDRRLDRWRVVNAGSVGRPYEGRPGAFWAVFGPDVSLRVTEYDYDAATRRIRATEYPDAGELVTDLYEQPISAQEASEFFESGATG